MCYGFEGKQMRVIYSTKQYGNFQFIRQWLKKQFSTGNNSEKEPVDTVSEVLNVWLGLHWEAGVTVRLLINQRGWLNWCFYPRCSASWGLCLACSQSSGKQHNIENRFIYFAKPLLSGWNKSLKASIYITALSQSLESICHKGFLNSYYQDLRWLAAIT